MTSFKLAALGVASLFFSLANAQPMSPALTPALKAALAPTGELRAVINTGNAVLAGLDAQQQAKGVSVDIARELAKRTGLPLTLVAVSYTHLRAHETG
jgi:ABC-type amino acid transport substrate-binding protein